MATESTVGDRQKLQEGIMSLINDWETDSLHNLIATLLEDLDVEQLATVAEEQGVDL